MPLPLSLAAQTIKVGVAAVASGITGQATAAGGNDMLRGDTHRGRTLHVARTAVDTVADYDVRTVLATKPRPDKQQRLAIARASW